MFPDDPYTQGLKRKTLESLKSGQPIQLGAPVDFRMQPLTIDPAAAKTSTQGVFGDYKPEPKDDTGGATISSQGSPSLGERLIAPFRDSQFGHAFGIDTRTDATRKAEDQGWNTPLVRFENAVPEPGVAHDVAQMASGLTSPKSMGLAAVAGPGGALPALEGTWGSSIFSNLLDAGFSADAIKGAYNQIPAAREAWDKGDYETFKRTLAQIGMQGTMGVAGGLGAFHTPENMTGLAQLPGKAYDALPSEATSAAANARLQQSGIYSGATAGMGKAFDPATLRDMTISTLGGVRSAAELAAAKARQIQELVRRPAPVEATAAEAPGRDVLARSVEDLERRIPNSQRVVSPDPTKLINGQPFSSLDMNAPSEGYLPFVHLGADEANHLNGRMWEDAIKESELPGGSAAMDAVRRTGARPPTAEFLHRSMQAPQRGRYWYELSGDSFTGGHIDIPREMQPGFIDNVAATSGGAKPYTNMKRALGTYAEDLQKVPIYTDLRDPASVRNALNPALDRLGTHKYQNFSGTMQYTSGLDNRPPLSVNDVQMADIFGIKGSDIGKNPALYEVLSRYTNKVRDAQNALLPEGGQPWETWQIQAPTWVQNRLDKDPKSTYDDYAMVLPRIIKELNDAGIETPNGKITLDTMRDPRFPNVMSGTRETLMGTPTATVEFATNKTPQGAAAAQTRAQLDQLDQNLPWVPKAIKRYEQIQRNSMKDFAERHGSGKTATPSSSSQLMSEITGQKLDVSRQEPTGYGTYEDDINPNLRIPMGGWNSKGEFVALDKPQREAFLSMTGQDLDQDGMAASHFTTVPHEPPGTPASPTRTYSVFMRRFDNQVDQKMVQNFSRQLGYPVNVSRTPNGILVDVNIADKGIGPTHEAVKAASDATFGQDDNVHDLATIPREYSSDFVHNSEYQEKIDAHQNKGNEPGGSGSAGDTPADLSNLQRIRQEIRAIAQRRDAEFAKWHDEVQARINPPPKVKKPKLPAE